MTNDMSRVDLTVKNERRRVVAMLFSKDSEGFLIISGIIENKISHMYVTDGPREIGTKAFGDRRNGVPGVTLGHHWGSIT